MLTTFHNIVLLGYGNIGQALSYSLRQRFPHIPIHVIDEHTTEQQERIAQSFGMTHQRLRVTQDNLDHELQHLVKRHTLVLNLATSISTKDLIDWAGANEAFYLDTCIDPWAYNDGHMEDDSNTNYAMREAVLKVVAKRTAKTTAVFAHGANPGFVSILLKQALLLMQKEHLGQTSVPLGRHQWAQLASSLGVQVVQISERDTQRSDTPRQTGEFVSTWSPEGYLAEALQPAEFGWGTHEVHGPLTSAFVGHAQGCQSGGYFKHLGVHCEVKSWTPASGEFSGNLISHNESLSIADYLTVRADGVATYRPTVYYAYHPCDEAVQSLALLKLGNRDAVLSHRVLKEELVDGMDELGVLLVSNKFPSLWFGSQLSLERARRIAPHNNATSLQVVGGIMAALEWMLLNPQAGALESDYLDYEFIFEAGRPYWEPLVAVFKQWHPRATEQGPLTMDQFLTVCA